MDRFGKLVRWFAVPAAVAWALQGCGGETPEPGAGNAPRAYGSQDGWETPAPPEPLRAEERLEMLAESIRDVRDATCVVIGDMAVVGIDVEGELDRSRVGTIKYAVAEALKSDPAGVNAVVTADIDLYHRLQEIRRDIAAGRAAEGFAEELADIVGRIMPQFPRDIEPRPEAEEPKATTEEGGARRAGGMDNRPAGEGAPGGPRG